LGIFRQGVTALEILTDLGWEMTINKEDSEYGCIQENIKRFTQANDTPPMKPSQFELLGWTACSDVAENILEGNFSLEHNNLHPAIERMLPYYKTPKTISDRGLISSSISTEEFIQGWKRSR
jgi:hypothetical protein